MVESLVGIAAGIELLRAVQPQIDEVGGHILGIGPRDRVGEDERHPVAPQEGHKGRVEKALMADLDRVPQVAPVPRLGPGALGEPVAAPFGEGGGGLGVARQQCQEMVETLGIEAKGRRELPEDRAELLLQPQDAGGKEIGERRLDLAQPPDMGDEARALDAEDEIRRRLGVPARVAFRALQRVERAVKLDRRKPARCVLELATLRQALRIERSAP